MEQKNRISHRGQALARLISRLTAERLLSDRYEQRQIASGRVRSLLLFLVVSRIHHDNHYFSRAHDRFASAEANVLAATESLYTHSLVYEEMPLLRFQLA